MWPHSSLSKEVRIDSCDPSKCWKFNADHEYHEKCARLHMKKLGTFFTFPPMFGQTDVGGEFTFPSCNHEEADTRIVVHIKYTMALGARQLQLRTVAHM